MKKSLTLFFLFSFCINSFSADKYWSGYGASDNISDGNNWWGNSNPSSGDNLYFDNSAGGRHFVYVNYSTNSYFGIVMTKNGAGGIKFYGDNTYAYKFENYSDGNLFELSPTSATVGSREIGNRINNDLEINPVGSGGILVSCDKVSIDNLNGTRGLKVYGGNTLTINGIIYERNGSGATLQLLGTAFVELKGNSTFTGLTTINGGTLKLNATGGALNSGNNVTISGGTLEIAQSQTIGNLSMSSGVLKINAGQTLVITGSYTVSGGTINNNGTIILQGSSSQTFPGTGVTINNGSAGQMNNLTINNSTGVIMNNSFGAATTIVSAGSKLDINSGITFTTTNLTLQSSQVNGTATIINNGTITATNTYVEQYLSGGRNWYISSPVTGASATVITNTVGNLLYERNESSATFPTASSFVSGKGYVATIGASNAGVYTFSGGSLNNGEVTIPISRTDAAAKAGFNLVGNPFPAHLKWLETTATTAGVEPTIWYRTYAGGYSFETYNAPSGLSVPNNNNGYIPPMQAFWVRKSVSGTGNLILNASNTVHRTSNPLKAKSLTNINDNKIVRLQISSNVNANKDETLLYFNPLTTNGFDNYDSPKWIQAIDTIPEIYSTSGTEQLVINGQPQIIENTEYPIGFRTGVTGAYTLKANELSNISDSYNVYLIDKQNLNPETELVENSTYTFNSDAVNTLNRFSLVFRAKGTTTGNCCYKTSDNKVSITKDADNNLIINCNCTNENKNFLSVYSLTGQKKSEFIVTGNTTCKIQNMEKGIYIIRLNTEGKTSTLKVTL